MAGTEGRRVTRNGVPGKMVKIDPYERFIPDDYEKHKHNRGSKGSRR